jgi:hypothetical protein
MKGAVTSGVRLKRKDASPPVSARDLRFLTGQLALFRLKVQDIAHKKSVERNVRRSL